MTACNVSIGQFSSVQPATPKRVIFCDFDGPIVDVSERYYQTYLKGLLAVELAAELATAQGQPLLAREQGLNLKPLSKAQFWRMKQNRVADLEIAMRSGLPAELFDPFMQQVKRIVNHPNLLRWDSLQPAALGALHYFKQRNIRLVLVTLRHPRQVQAFLRSQGLEPLIDEVFGALDMNAAHANRVDHKCELLMQAIAQQKDLGHLTQNSWMIGDTEADVRAGQLMGLSTAALCCGVRSKTYLQTLSPSKVYGCLMTAALDVVKMPLLQAA
ncbi:MAG: putative phosphatase [Phormidesmis priestleyi Ana]|uniref:Putative phosphatase n=1 Tax=Phormidesmis priestleyi Ana TaxID=1666911 RepID=A0A0P7ZV67_9CYAN|nr:MAG: putative phosphatase [Phormidesmis priestleyi Ana]